MIQFEEATHTYTKNGVILPSVTEITRFLAYDYKTDRPWLAEEAARRGTAVHEACTMFPAIGSQNSRRIHFNRSSSTIQSSRRLKYICIYSIYCYWSSTSPNLDVQCFSC